MLRYPELLHILSSDQLHPRHLSTTWYPQYHRQCWTHDEQSRVSSFQPILMNWKKIFLKIFFKPFQQMFLLNLDKCRCRSWARVLQSKQQHCSNHGQMKIIFRQTWVKLNNPRGSWSYVTFLPEISKIPGSSPKCNNCWPLKLSFVRLY